MFRSVTFLMDTVALPGTRVVWLQYFSYVPIHPVLVKVFPSAEY